WGELQRIVDFAAENRLPAVYAFREFVEAGGPILAREIPSAENGGVSRDGLSVTWKLKQGVTWHDGKPFTADDVVFTWEYTADPATGSPRQGASQDLERAEVLDRHTVRFVFKTPTSYW